MHFEQISNSLVVEQLPHGLACFLRCLYPRSAAPLYRATPYLQLHQRLTVVLKSRTRKYIPHYTFHQQLSSHFFPFYSYSILNFLKLNITIIVVLKSSTHKNIPCYTLHQQLSSFPFLFLQCSITF